MQYRVRWFSDEVDYEMSFDEFDSAMTVFRTVRDTWGPVVLSLFAPDGTELDYHDSL